MVGKDGLKVGLSTQSAEEKDQGEGGASPGGETIRDSEVDVLFRGEGAEVSLILPPDTPALAPDFVPGQDSDEDPPETPKEPLSPLKQSRKLEIRRKKGRTNLKSPRNRGHGRGSPESMQSSPSRIEEGEVTGGLSLASDLEGLKPAATLGSPAPQEATASPKLHRASWALAGILSPKRKKSNPKSPRDPKSPRADEERGTVFTAPPRPFRKMSKSPQRSREPSKEAAGEVQAETAEIQKDGVNREEVSKSLVIDEETQEELEGGNGEKPADSEAGTEAVTKEGTPPPRAKRPLGKLPAKGESPRKRTGDSQQSPPKKAK